MLCEPTASPRSTAPSRAPPVTTAGFLVGTDTITGVRFLSYKRTNHIARERNQYLNRKQSRLRNKIDRLLTDVSRGADHSGQWRWQMKEPRQQEQVVRSEPQSLHMAAQDHPQYLRVLDSFSDFRARLQGDADQLRTSKNHPAPGQGDLAVSRRLDRFSPPPVYATTRSPAALYTVPPTSRKPTNLPSNS